MESPQGLWEFCTVVFRILQGCMLGDRTDLLSCHRLSSLCMCIGVIQAIESYVQMREMSMAQFHCP